MKNCPKCKKYKLLNDDDRNCLVHACREYRFIKVYGVLDGPINPSCTAYDPIEPKKIRSLAEMTLDRAGGPWSEEVKKYDKKDLLKNKRIFECKVCKKQLKYRSEYCDDCAPEEIKKRREYHREIYNKSKKRGKKDE